MPENKTGMQKEPHSSRHRTVLPFHIMWGLPLGAAALSLLVRFIYLYLSKDLAAFLSPGMDAELYRTWAERILAGLPQVEPYFRGPLYPYLVAFLGGIFSGDTFWAIRVFQIVVSAIATGVLASIAFRWYNFAAGWATAIAWSLYGMSIYFDAEGLITSLFTSYLIFLLFFIDLYRRKARIRWTVLAAITLGAMTIMRANALVLWPVLFWALAARPGAKRKKRTHPAWAAPVLAGFILIAISIPVASFNHSRGGNWTISTQGGINLFLGNNPQADGAYAVDPQYGPDWTRAQIEYRAAKASGKTVLSDSRVNNYYLKRSLYYWYKHPIQATGKTFRKFIIFLNARELGNNRPIQPFLWQVSPVFYFLALIGFPLVAIFGISFIPESWRVVPDSRPAIVLLAVYVLSMLAFFVNARYRFPITPILVMLAAGSIAAIPKWLNAYHEKKLYPWITIGVRVIVALVVLLPKPVSTAGIDESWRFHNATAHLRLAGLLGDRPETRNHGVNFATRKEHVKEAESQLHQLLATDQAYPNANLNMGLCFLARNSLDSAQVYFTREIQLGTNKSGAYNNLGVVELKRGQYENAERYYRQAIEQDYTNPDAKRNLAALLNETIRTSIEDESSLEGMQIARERLEEATLLAPENPTYHLNLAMMELFFADTSRAVNRLFRVLQLNPNSSTARLMLKDLGFDPVQAKPSESDSTAN